MPRPPLFCSPALSLRLLSLLVREVLSSCAPSSRGGKQKQKIRGGVKNIRSPSIRIRLGYQIADANPATREARGRARLLVGRGGSQASSPGSMKGMENVSESWLKGVRAPLTYCGREMTLWSSPLSVLVPPGGKISSSLLGQERFCLSLGCTTRTLVRSLL